MSARFEYAREALDRLHAGDPKQIVVAGERLPAELVYARRMTAALARLVPEPSVELSLAVRAQHLCRWTRPRTAYPEGRVGYLAWRRDASREHAALAAKVLGDAGYPPESISRVEALIQKRRFKTDEEAQAVEDAACLVFLEFELEGFSRGRDPVEVQKILDKTWAKMSERAHLLANEASTSGSVREP